MSRVDETVIAAFLPLVDCAVLVAVGMPPKAWQPLAPFDGVDFTPLALDDYLKRLARRG